MQTNKHHLTHILIALYLILATNLSAGWTIYYLPEKVTLGYTEKAKGHQTLTSALKEIKAKGKISQIDFMRPGKLTNDETFQAELIKAFQEIAPKEWTDATNSAGNMHNPKMRQLWKSLSPAFTKTSLSKNISKELAPFNLSISEFGQEKLSYQKLDSKDPKSKRTITGIFHIGIKPLKKTITYDPSVPTPALTNIRYGENHRNILDLWKAKSDSPTPLVLVIHGGGWNGGQKEIIHRFVDTQALLDAGISVAAINYRLIKHSKDLDPHVKGPMSDATRAIQFIRSKANEWNIDKARIALTGGSAGACTSLWLAYHDDQANPQSQDPVEHQSTKPFCVAVSQAQTTLDPKQAKEWISNSKYGGHAFGKSNFKQFLEERETILTHINKYSPYALLTKDDPPTYLFYRKPPAEDKHEKDPTHSSIFGIKLQEHCKKTNVRCELVYPGAKNIKHKTVTDYLIKNLTH